MRWGMSLEALCSSGELRVINGDDNEDVLDDDH